MRLCIAYGIYMMRCCHKFMITFIWNEELRVWRKRVEMSNLKVRRVLDEWG